MSLGEFFNDVFSGNIEHAKKRVIDWWSDSVAPELSNLVKRLTSDAGKIAEEVARDAWQNWQDGDDLLTIAKKAVEEAALKGIVVLEQDVADWLGILDRNET